MAYPWGIYTCALFPVCFRPAQPEGLPQVTLTWRKHCFRMGRSQKCRMKKERGLGTGVAIALFMFGVFLIPSQVHLFKA